MSSPERLAGFAEPLPVCGAWGGDGVARGGGEGGAALLAAADGRGSAWCGNGCHPKVHPKRRVEMVTLNTHSDLTHTVNIRTARRSWDLCNYQITYESSNY